MPHPNHPTGSTVASGHDATAAAAPAPGYNPPKGYPGHQAPSPAPPAASPPPKKRRRPPAPRPQPKRRYTHPEARKVAKRVVRRGLEDGLSRKEMVKATERVVQRLGWDDPRKPSKTPDGRKIQSPPRNLHKQAVRAVDRYLSAGPENTERPEPRKPVRRDPRDPTDGPVDTERPEPSPPRLPRELRQVTKGIDRKLGQITGETPSPQEKRRVTHRLKKAADRSGGKFLDDTLNPDQQKWARAFSKELGVSLDFAAAEALREGGNGTPGDNNWANIGWTDSGPVGVTKAPEWRDPTTAGKTTAKWIKGEWGDQYDYNPAEGILEIGRLAKSGASERAIGRQWANSGWASAGAGPLDTLGDVPISEGAKVPATLKRKARRTIGPLNTKAILKDVDLSPAERVKNPQQRRAIKQILVGKMPKDADELIGKAAVKALREGGEIVKAPKGDKNGLLAGRYAGSKALVQEIVGSKVRGDHGGTKHGEAPGVHSAEGDHYRPDGYAQDINGDNPRENEPAYTQESLDKIVANLRKMGATDVPDLQIGSNWEGQVGGYSVQLLTNEGGTVNHIHVGAHPSGDEGDLTPTGPKIKGTDLVVMPRTETGSTGASTAGTSAFTGVSGSSSGGTGKPGKKGKGRRRRRRPIPSAQYEGDDGLGTYLAVGADTPTDPFIERLIELQQS